MEKKRIIFSDLDHTLIDKEYSFKKALLAINTLKENNIPLILCSSKTRAEIEFYRSKLENKHPFISENGGGIFIPINYFKKIPENAYLKGKYLVIDLGTPYEQLLIVLNKIKKNIPLKNFHEMSLKELVKHSGLSSKEAKLAKKREYDEAFYLENKKDEKRLINLIKKNNLFHTKGGRYFHIMGNNDKGKAVKILMDLYREEYKNIFSMGFGDSQNDYSMLKETDKGFLVKKGPLEVNNIIMRELRINKSEIKKAEKLYRKSIRILKKFQLRNGGILASSPKGRYPYVYPRDHAICILGLIESREFKRAKKALQFLFLTQYKNGSFPQRANKKGEDASYKPIQLDNTALSLYAFARYIQEARDLIFLKESKKKINLAIKYIESQLERKKYLFFTPNSIHEFPPYEEGLEIWVNSVCYAALYEIKKLKFKSKINLANLKKKIEKYFFNGEYFIKNIRLNESSSIAREIDASSYSLADFGVFQDDNQKIKKTVERIEKELWHKEIGGICRYPKHIGRNNGGYGPWTHFTLIIARHYIRMKNKEKADKYLKWVLDFSYNFLFPEHIATKKEFEEWVSDYRKAGILRKDRETMIDNIRKSKPYKKGLAYSVLPLAWPHAEFIRTWNLYKEKFFNP